MFNDVTPSVIGIFVGVYFDIRATVKSFASFETDFDDVLVIVFPMPERVDAVFDEELIVRESKVKVLSEEYRKYGE